MKKSGKGGKGKGEDKGKGGGKGKGKGRKGAATGSRKRLVFVRHGEGCHNYTAKSMHADWKGCSGFPDAPLTYVGIAQALSLATNPALLQSMQEGAHVQCSPLRRAQDTMRYALRASASTGEGLFVQVSPFVNELNCCARCCPCLATLMNGAENTSLPEAEQRRLWELKHPADCWSDDASSARSRMEYPDTSFTGHWPSDYQECDPERYLNELWSASADSVVLFGHSGWFKTLVKVLDIPLSEFFAEEKYSSGKCANTPEEKLGHCDICELTIDARVSYSLKGRVFSCKSWKVFPCRPMDELVTNLPHSEFERNLMTSELDKLSRCEDSRGASATLEDFKEHFEELLENETKMRGSHCAASGLVVSADSSTGGTTLNQQNVTQPTLNTQKADQAPNQPRQPQVSRKADQLPPCMQRVDGMANVSI